MKFKFKLKIIVDIIMTVLLILLMSFQVTGQMAHEYIGISMFVLFVLHNFLNIKWYDSLLKGRYTALRMIHTIVNVCMLFVMLFAMLSGIVVSKFAFSFLDLHFFIAVARKIHLVASYICFVLMSIHIGLHWGMVVALIKKININTAILRAISTLIAIYGAYSAYENKIFYYMFLKSEFVFFDFSKNGALVIIQYLSIIGLFVYITYYVTKFLRNKGE